MDIKEISKWQKETTVTLTSSDLITICNALYRQYDAEKENESFIQLYSDMMIARDMCIYGHLDNESLHSIVKCRNELDVGVQGILPDNDVETFNSYLQDNDIKTAFRNSDWRAIYNKIVGSNNPHSYINEKTE